VVCGITCTAPWAAIDSKGGTALGKKYAGWSENSFWGRILVTRGTYRTVGTIVNVTQDMERGDFEKIQDPLYFNKGDMQHKSESLKS
jgi:hypothetical protein